MRNLTGMMALTWSLLLALALGCTNRGTAFASTDRPLDGFEYSGYDFPKTLVWRGIRSSPGTLWLFYVIFVYCAFNIVYLSLMSSVVAIAKGAVDTDESGLVGTDELAQETNMSPKQAMSMLETGMALRMNEVAAMVTTALGFGVLFVSLSATRVSEMVEAYLVVMVSIQMLLLLATWRWGQRGIWCLQLGAMFGIAMLDSYRPLNLLNFAYFVAALFMQASILLVGDFPPRIREGLYPFLSCLQMGFSIAAFVVAGKVEGAHRGPMLALLCTACVCTGSSLLQALCVGMLRMRRRPKTGTGHTI